MTRKSKTAASPPHADHDYLAPVRAWPSLNRYQPRLAALLRPAGIGGPRSQPEPTVAQNFVVGDSPRLAPKPAWLVRPPAGRSKA